MWNLDQLCCLLEGEKGASVLHDGLCQGPNISRFLILFH